jgi:hypothetical protein
MSSNSKRKEILFTVVSLIIFFALIEISFRLYVWKKGIPYHELSLDISKSAYVPHPYLGYVPNPGYKNENYKLPDGKKGTFSINSLGFRGPEISRQKPPDTIRIACLGGSTTMTVKTSDEYTYPRLLEIMLREKYPEKHIEVINAGVGGYTSIESFINFQLRILELQPDIIIIYHAENDVHPRVVNNFQSDYSHYRKPLIIERKCLLEHIFEHSYVYLFVRYRLKRWQMGIQRLTTKQWPPSIPLEKQKENFAKTTPETFRRNIQSIIDLAKAKKIKVILSTFIINKELLQQTKVGINHEVYYEGIQQNNEIMREISKKENVLLVDIASTFPSDNKSLFADFSHLNEKGTKIKSLLFFKDIVQNKLVEEVAALQKSRSNIQE